MSPEAYLGLITSILSAVLGFFILKHPNTFLKNYFKKIEEQSLEFEESEKKITQGFKLAKYIGTFVLVVSGAILLYTLTLVVFGS